MGQTRWITPKQVSISNAQLGEWRAHYGMLLWVLIVGMSFPAVGMMSEGLPSLLLTAIRSTIGNPNARCGRRAGPVAERLSGA
jgi:hypothetical protein